MRIAKIRRGLYWLADRLGDVEAVKHGRVREHMRNRMVGCVVSRLTRKLWR